MADGVMRGPAGLVGMKNEIWICPARSELRLGGRVLGCRPVVCIVLCRIDGRMLCCAPGDWRTIVLCAAECAELLSHDALAVASHSGSCFLPPPHRTKS